MNKYENLFFGLLVLGPTEADLLQLSNHGAAQFEIFKVSAFLRRSKISIASFQILLLSRTSALLICTIQRNCQFPPISREEADLVKIRQMLLRLIAFFRCSQYFRRFWWEWFYILTCERRHCETGRKLTEIKLFAETLRKRKSTPKNAPLLVCEE